MVGMMAAAQVSAAREADDYVTRILTELDYGPPIGESALNPQRFAGVDGSGLPLDTLFAQSLIELDRQLDRDAADMLAALRATEPWIEGVTETVLGDTNRAAETVAAGQRPWIAGYIRAAEPGACSRCMILSGKFFMFNEGFRRHPRCRCTHIPAPDAKDASNALIKAESPESHFWSLTEEEQDKTFGEAGAQAIRDGADMAQVVNARRGMQRAQYAGQNVLTTTVGTTRGPRRNSIRLMPESIMRIAGDDADERIRLLRLHGYIR